MSHRKGPRPAASLAAVLVVAIGLLACGPGAAPEPYAAELRMPGTLTVCLALLGEPAAATARTESAEPYGYNVDFAREVADRLELELDLTETAFSELIDAVREHRCDISVSSQNITTGRLEEIDFVPYTRARQRVLVAKDNPHSISSIEELCGHLVSVTEGSILVDMVEGTGDFNGFGLSQACLAGGRRPIEVHRFPDHEEAVQALLDGLVAAHLGNPNFVFRYPDQLSQSPATLPAARQGIGVAKDRPELRVAVSRVLVAMIDDGTYRGILVDHLGSDERARAGSIEGSTDPPIEQR